MDRFDISKEDKEILRKVARNQLEFANMERNRELANEWTLHNELKGDRPMIHLEMDTFEQEILPERMKCQGTFAREVEKKLYKNFLNQELFDDDRVTPDYYGVLYDTNFKLFGIDIKVQEAFDSNGDKSVGHQFAHIINDLEEDYEKLGKTIYDVDIQGTLEKKAKIEEAIGDILPVKLIGNCMVSVPTQMVVHFMGMENMMFNMYDYPELFKEMMNRISDDTLAYFRFLEENKVLLPTTESENLGQGSFCYNKTLPKQKDLFTTKDLWGFMDSQETVSISPDMYKEFIFPTYKKISENFGLFSYGCCEPVDPIWDNCISKLDNLRKVSISPWCNEEYMGEKLKGSKTIFHRKPTPNYLGVGSVLDEEAFRSHIKKSLLAAQGCKMEITQRDVYTINRDIPKAKRYIEIIREEIVKYW